MKPLKVLILITKSNWGGAQRYVFDLAKRLSRDSFDVEVMAGGEGPLITKLKEHGINAEGGLPIGRDIGLARDIKAFFRLWRILRHKKPNILHLNSSKIGVLGALAGRLAGIRAVVFTAHGWAFNENRSAFQKAILAFSYWLTVMLAHKTIAVSEAVRQQVAAWPFVRRKIQVIHNGIADVTRAEQTEARRELRQLNTALRLAASTVPEEKQVWLGTIAELHPIKGHEHAIEAVASLIEATGETKRIFYAVFGEGEERTKLERLIKERGLENNVFLLGHVDDAARYLKALDAFVLASVSEGLGYVLLETALAGVPIVATTVGGIPEVIEHGVTGRLVPPGDIAALAREIAWVMDHPEEARTMAAAARARVQKDFTEATMVDETGKIYEQLVKGDS